MGQDPLKDGEMLDIHIKFDPNASKKGMPPRWNSDGLVIVPGSYSTDEMNQIDIEIDDAIMNSISQNAGNIPAGILRKYGDLLSPKIKWQDAMREVMRGFIRKDPSWMVLNRKGWHLSPVILPGRELSKRLEACVAFDCSGSVSERQLRQFLGDFNQLMLDFDEFSLRMWQFDAEIYNDQEVTSDNPYDVREWNVSGGGGTMFEKNWEYMRENFIQPNVFIMFTDGYPCGDWGEPDYCDTIFIICNEKGGEKPEAPFGQTFYCEV